MKIFHQNGAIECDSNHLVEIIKDNDIISVNASELKVNDILIQHRIEHVFDEQPVEHVNNLAFFWLFGVIQSCGIVEKQKITLYFEEHRVEHILKALCGLFKIDAFYETVDVSKDPRFVRTRTFKINNRVVLSRNQILDRIVDKLENWFEFVSKNDKNVHFAFLQGVYDATGGSAKSKSPIFSHNNKNFDLGKYQIMLERCGVFSQVIKLNRREYFTKKDIHVLIIGNAIDRDLYNKSQKVGFKRFIGSYSQYGNRYPFEFVREYFGVTANAVYRKKGVPVGNVGKFREYNMVPSKVFAIL